MRCPSGNRVREGFRCLRCGECCRSLVPIIVLSDVETWVKGEAWHVVRAIEVTEAAGVLRKLGIESCFVLRRRNGACYFYRGGECSIYNIRPMVCRLFPFAYSEAGVVVHPWALNNCLAIRMCGAPRPADELRELAERIMRELLGLPFYASLVEELLRSTGRVVRRERLRVRLEAL